MSWPDVKQAFVKAQRGKCIYCERKIGSDSAKKVEWDVEHFRPKGRVTEWEPGTGPASPGGYYLLALNWRNYLASCKRCNSGRKRDYFPVAKPPRQLTVEEPAKARRESAYLPFPLGESAEDPEELIEFIGCKPVAKSSAARVRADLVIRFFDLDVSEDLIEDRANVIVALYTFLRERDRKDEDSAAAEERIAIARSAGFAHGNCARSFIRLYDSDPA